VKSQTPRSITATVLPAGAGTEPASQASPTARVSPASVRSWSIRGTSEPWIAVNCVPFSVVATTR